LDVGNGVGSFATGIAVIHVHFAHPFCGLDGLLLPAVGSGSQSRSARRSLKTVFDFLKYVCGVQHEAFGKGLCFIARGD
jgi:hypothetical protein